MCYRQTRRVVSRQKILVQDSSLHRIFRKVYYTQIFFYRQTLLQTETFAHRGFYTQTLLHTDAFTHTHTFTHRRFYTQTLLHTDAFTHRSFYTQRLLHRGFYTQTLLHTKALTHRGFCTQRLLGWDNNSRTRGRTTWYLCLWVKKHIEIYFKAFRKRPRVGWLYIC